MVGMLSIVRWVEALLVASVRWAGPLVGVFRVRLFFGALAGDGVEIL